MEVGVYIVASEIDPTVVTPSPTAGIPLINGKFAENEQFIVMARNVEFDTNFVPKPKVLGEKHQWQSERLRDLRSGESVSGLSAHFFSAPNDFGALRVAEVTGFLATKKQA